MVNDETNDKARLIRELKVARAQLALEIERGNNQLEVSKKLIQNLKDETNIMVQRIKAQVAKRKELTISLERKRQKNKELTQRIEELSRGNILEFNKKAAKNSLHWLENLNILKKEYAS